MNHRPNYRTEPQNHFFIHIGHQSIIMRSLRNCKIFSFSLFKNSEKGGANKHAQANLAYISSKQHSIAIKFRTTMKTTKKPSANGAHTSTSLGCCRQTAQLYVWRSTCYKRKQTVSSINSRRWNRQKIRPILVSRGKQPCLRGTKIPLYYNFGYTNGSLCSENQLALSAVSIQYRRVTDRWRDIGLLHSIYLVNHMRCTCVTR